MDPLLVIQMIWDAWTKPRQHVVVQGIPPGKTLDIGGGGEGVIAQAGGARIVAVDRYLSETHEARGKALAAAWVTADAAELPFENHCFDSATAFFSCMYMPDDTMQKVFRETWRILREGGELWIWDTCMVFRSKAFAIRLRVDLPGRPAIHTTYGVRAKTQSAASIAGLLQEAGFELQAIIEQKSWFLIKARRV